MNVHARGFQRSRCPERKVEDFPITRRFAIRSDFDSVVRRARSQFYARSWPHGALVGQLVIPGPTKSNSLGAAHSALCQHGYTSAGGVLAPTNLVGWLPFDGLKCS